jgi:hypothetical protein
MPGLPVLCMQDIASQSATELLNRFGLAACWLDQQEDIKGSFWGAPEAGIIGTRVYIRADTPVHSFLHETSHIICMSPELRQNHTGNAGSDDLEETAVCYLQILLGETLPGVGRDRLIQDMDEWGYSFRLGSTGRWFAHDADDAKKWLQDHNVLDDAGRPTGHCRSMN